MSSNTIAKQPIPPQLVGKGFKKGDPRINRKGRPKSFDQLRALAQEIAHEKFGTVSKIRAILMRWSVSNDVAKQKAFIEYAYGKVPDKIEGELTTKKTLTLYYDHEWAGRNGHRRQTPGVSSGTS